MHDSGHQKKKKEKKTFIVIVNWCMDSSLILNKVDLFLLKTEKCDWTEVHWVLNALVNIITLMTAFHCTSHTFFNLSAPSTELDRTLYEASADTCYKSPHVFSIVVLPIQTWWVSSLWNCISFISAYKLIKKR